MENENRTLNDAKFRELLQKNITHRVSSVSKDLVDFRVNLQQSAQVIIDNISQILSNVEDEFLEGLRQELSLVESGLRGRLEPEFRARLEAQLRQEIKAEFDERLKDARQSSSNIATQTLDAKLGTLDAAIREISLQNNQVDILSCYLDKAELFAPRVALFVFKSGNLMGWQARGFDGEFNNASIRALMFSADRENFLLKVAETRVTYLTRTEGRPELLDIVAKFGPLAPDTVCVIPLVVREKPVAVLYADSGLIPNASLNASGLEIITTVVSLTVELSSARAKLGAKQAEPVRALRPEMKVASPAQPVARPAEADTQPAGSGPGVHFAESLPDESHSAQQAAQSEATPLPAPVAPSLQSFAAEPPTAPHAATTAKPVADKASGVGEPDEAEQKLHNDARRFARLLISEIKLYNEQKVQAGRRDKNLYSLLRDDIDKSREMYEKRVSSTVTAKTDYFYDELVRILGDNQVSSLGADCPGPVLLAQ
jgi:hypothetical protein